MTSYPESAAERARWVLARRSERAASDPMIPNGFFIEDERTVDGRIVPVATVLLTNRECPFRCLMCDLWKHTLKEKVAEGAIGYQIDHALERLSQASQIKLYNSGSFFDPRAIPQGDLPGIAGRLKGFERVIVESHPAFLNERSVGFRKLIDGELEVAIGLECAHPETLARLNKGMTLDSFQSAAELLARHSIGLRVFILVRPPFLAEHEAGEWTMRSVEFAFDCGATAVSLIPTRAGNGALEALAKQGLFEEPVMADLERTHAAAIRLGRGRVFADMWDLERFSRCRGCFAERCERIRRMNLEQYVEPAVKCGNCG